MDTAAPTAATAAYDIPALKAAYDADGFVKVPGLVSQAWVERLTAVIHEFLKRDPGDPYSTYFGHGPGRTTIRWMWREMDEVQRFARESGVAPVIAGIIGSRSAFLWYDNTFIHEGGHEGEHQAGTPWHHDVVAFPFKGAQNPSVWIALTPIDGDNAPLACLRGSHRTGALYRPVVYTDQNAPVADGFSAPPDWQALIEAGEWEPVWYPMAPGDVLMIHPNTIHGAPPVKAGAPTRIGMSTRWGGDDLRWWPHPYALDFPGVDYARVTPGTRPEGPLFPVAWRAGD